MTSSLSTWTGSMSYFHVFDVEHGFCALFIAPSGASMLIDCGHNGSNGFRPSAYLSRAYGFDAVARPITALVVANFDEDHLSDFPKTLSNLRPQIIYSNPSVTPTRVVQIKAGANLGSGVLSCATELATRYTRPAPPVDWAGASVSFFWVNYPWVTDSNNLSLVTFVEFGAARIMIPGDLERAGWLCLLTREDFRRALARTTVFIASHHGRESGLCEDVFRYCRPEVVIISDQGIEFESQTTDYGRFASGVHFSDGRERKCVTTRNNGDIAVWGSLAGAATISISRR